MPSFLVVFAVHAIVVACFSSLLAVLKHLLRSTCNPDKSITTDTLLEIINSVVMVCMVLAAFSPVASAAYFFKSRAWSHAAAVCSKWQPVYFLFVSVQRLVLRVIVTVVDIKNESCSKNDNSIHAISLIWNCAILMTALSTLSCDLHAELTPVLRRCAYGVFALVLIVDAISSVWSGNLLANKATFSVASMSFLLDNFITSSIASQVVLALHFVYVSCRSRRGRGWSHASLRFELDERGQLSMQRLLESTPSRSEGGAAVAASITTPMMLESASSESRYEAARGRGLFARLRQRWLQFKQRQLLRCGVFVIPCVAAQDAATGAENQFVLARPAFELRCLRPLQWSAEKYPKCYVTVAWILIGSRIFMYSLFEGFEPSSSPFRAPNLVASFLMVVHMLGFLSSKRWGIDRVAAKHIAKSFRFVVIAVLLSIDVALDALKAFSHLQNLDPRYYQPASPPNDSDKFWVMTIPIGTALANLYWCLCILLDCSPHVPPAVQFYISVNARKVIMLQLYFHEYPAGRRLVLFWSSRVCEFISNHFASFV
jgi:hypothetical protein